jgi:hypothetical protein
MPCKKEEDEVKLSEGVRGILFLIPNSSFLILFATAIYTNPRGFSSVAPVGPEMPVVAIA